MTDCDSINTFMSGISGSFVIPPFSSVEVGVATCLYSVFNDDLNTPYEFGYGEFVGWSFEAASSCFDSVPPGGSQAGCLPLSECFIWSITVSNPEVAS
ncbi:hypothetical protein FA95DRAFT_1562664 [Auriscalpium vulgare]|uniref:Uncharacterized protein n=1 Tax=Auriscalpium vulgare TaxID=40419 RepID=A0ACB8RKL6_9AGAM|nr:hypothetical protein FA95DRAFT_1562664 [Auriscalpium vulgare]